MRRALVTFTFALAACGATKSEPAQTASEVTVPAAAPPASDEAVPPPPPPDAAPAASARSQSADDDTDAGAAQFGMIGLYGTGDGNMTGRNIGEAFGTGGLGLSDGGAGLGTMRGRTPSLRQGATQVNGRLPPEVIQRIVRQNFGRFRLCYERALVKKPKLAGRIDVRYVIDRFGAATDVSVKASTLKDADLETCVTRAFEGISYPQPEAGTVTVVYPILFAPSSP
jgi:hypothetical protein